MTKYRLINDSAKQEFGGRTFEMIVTQRFNHVSKLGALHIVVLCDGAVVDSASTSMEPEISKGFAAQRLARWMRDSDYKRDDALGCEIAAAGDSLFDRYPALIAAVRTIYAGAEGAPGRGVDRAVESIREAGVTDQALTLSLLEACGYNAERERMAMSVVARCSRRA